MGSGPFRAPPPEGPKNLIFTGGMPNLLSKLQSNAAPCQSEVLVLKKVVMLKGVTLEIVLPTPSPPQFFGKLEKEFWTLAKQ